MPYRTTTFISGHYYHLYNRGNHREAVFFEEDNYRYFLHLFRRHIPAEKISLLAYCLMPNHYHFLVELREDADLSSMMRNLIIAYTKAINKRYSIVGHLFQGRFQCKLVDTEEYLLNLVRYIHLNPVKGNLVRAPEDSRHSSYAEYLGLRRDPVAFTERILQHFRTLEEFKRFSEESASSDIGIPWNPDI